MQTIPPDTSGVTDGARSEIRDYRRGAAAPLRAYRPALQFRLGQHEPHPSGQMSYPLRFNLEL